MRIAITATGPGLDAAVDPRFGRCPCFLIVDPDDLSFEAIENESVMLGQGAGIQSAQRIAEKGVTAVLTGNCGPNAHQTLLAAGVQVIVGCSGPVRDVISQFKAGQLGAADQPNVPGHTGMAGGPQDPGAPMQQPGMRAGGGGRGMGRGQGMGRGRGMGRGMGRGVDVNGGWPGVGPAPAPPGGQPPSKEDQLAALKGQAEVLAEQMRQLQQQISQLEQEG